MELPVLLAQALIPWYEENGRVLPWREEPSPYRVWISEIMLQQTRVETVKDYFERFLRAFPTVRDLADSEEETVLKLWEGLGYYSRARHLREAARRITEAYGGEMPREKEKLTALPGIGSYTAGAICAFAFNEPEPAVDGNVLRVTARLCDSSEDVLQEKTKKAVERAVRERIPEGKAGVFGQALLELGETVCLPGEPKCAVCPLRGMCLGRLRSREKDLPVRGVRTVRREEERWVFLLYDGERYAVRKRKEKLLFGLYEFPNERVENVKESPEKYAEKTFGVKVVSTETSVEARHAFTHLVWNLKGIRCMCRKKEESPDLLWLTERELNEVAIPSAFRAYRRAIRNEKKE